MTPPPVPEAERLSDDLAVWLMACDECNTSEPPDQYLAHFRDFLTHCRAVEHQGDCPHAERPAPFTCPRCVCDDYLIRAEQTLSGPLAPILAQRDEALAALKGAQARATAAEAENDLLRASLANSGGPCVYCQLPREDWSKCRSGFPGCGRSDDAMLCPNIGAWLEFGERLTRAEAQNEGLRRTLEPFARLSDECDQYTDDLGQPRRHDDTWVYIPRCVGITHGDLRAARAALSQPEATDAQP